MREGKKNPSRNQNDCEAAFVCCLNHKTLRSASNWGSQHFETINDSHFHVRSTGRRTVIWPFNSVLSRMCYGDTERLVMLIFYVMFIKSSSSCHIRFQSHIKKERSDVKRRDRLEVSIRFDGKAVTAFYGRFVYAHVVLISMLRSERSIYFGAGRIMRFDSRNDSVCSPVKIKNAKKFTMWSCVFLSVFNTVSITLIGLFGAEI